MPLITSDLRFHMNFDHREKRVADDDKSVPTTPNKAIGVGVAMGIVTGAVVGATTGQVGFWISIGLTIGASVGAAVQVAQSKK